MEYLEDSEVDFSSDSDDDDEDDLEDIAGRDEGRRSAGHLGKRPSGILLLQLLCIDTAHDTSRAVDAPACKTHLVQHVFASVLPNNMQHIVHLARSCCQQQLHARPKA